MKKSFIYERKAELVAMKAGLELFAFDGSENGSEIAAADAAIEQLDDQIKKIDDDYRKESIIFNTIAVCVISCSIVAIVLVFIVL